MEYCRVHGRDQDPALEKNSLKGGDNMMTIEERLENMERDLGRLKRRNRWLLGTILLVAGG
jgi:hypothetical protein